MSNNLQKRLNQLKPYVIGIRFVEGMSVVDTILKDGWKVPVSKLVLTGTTDDSPNYFMFYSENENIEIDEILDFIGETIKINIEREKKFELLGVKFKELENLFKNNSLSRLESMKFVLGETPILPETMNENFLAPSFTMDSLDGDEFKEEVTDIPVVPQKKGRLVDEPMEEFKEEMSPENQFTTKYNNEIELPPRNKKIEVEVFEEYPVGDCKHPSDQFCPNCIDY